MHFLIVTVLIASTSTVFSQHAVKFLEEDAVIQRRQGVSSYSTSVIHENPKYPDQRAESSIKVDFNTQRGTKPRQGLKTGRQNSNQQRQPKAIQTYAQIPQNYPNAYQQPARQQYSVEEKIPQANNHVFAKVQNFDSNPQSQSFNVGYSVSFTGDSKPHIPTRTFPNHKLENAEIITGSRKDVVQKPNSNFDANDFVSGALIDLKKQKVTGIKPKNHKYPNHKDVTDVKSFINNLAPQTQQYLSYLGQAKPVGSSNPHFRQQLQQQSNTQVSWTNLSPSVEIYHSRELPQNQIFRPKEQQEQSKKFDHAAALGKSQGFDYTNIIEGQLEKAQQHQQPTVAPVSTQIDNKNQLSFTQGFPEFNGHITGNSLLGQTEKQPTFVQTFPQISAGQFPEGVLADKTQANLFQQYPELSHVPTSIPISSLNLQASQKTDNSQNVGGKQHPLLRTEGSGSSVKFPIDVSLLRNPILASNVGNLPNNPHTIAIPFDTTLLQAMRQKLVTNPQQNHQAFDAGKGQVQALHVTAGIPSQHQYQGQLGNLQVPTNFQNHGFQDFQGQQTQQQLNFYGNPQQTLFANKDFDQYFNKYLDKMQAQESRIDGLSFVPQVQGNLKTSRDVEMQTDLRPPPVVKIARHRRTYIG